MKGIILAALICLLAIYVTACNTDNIATLIPTQKPTSIQTIPPHLSKGSASPSVEWRIYESDAVVIATLLSADGSSLRFKVIEYLKGTGPTDITVNADLTNRDTRHDNLEAVLFLSRGGFGASEESNGEFLFTDTHYSDSGYTIDTLDPAWLPADTISGSAANDGNSNAFITDSGLATGRDRETISLADLRTKVAWMEGGENIDGYDNCIGGVLNYLQDLRDYETYYGKPRTPHESHVSLTSGMGVGTEVEDFGVTYGKGYGRFWLTGRDSDFFRAVIIDENESAIDGSYEIIETARPLPAGAYKFRYHGTLYRYIPCNFTPIDGIGQLDFVVTVTAPGGTLHEAFFDPVESGEDEVSPASFSVGGTATEIMGLEWADGKVVLSLDPVVSLDGYTSDFIELDGSVSLSLRVLDATVDVDKGVYSWPVADRPWESGDKLMLRIRED